MIAVIVSAFSRAFAQILDPRLLRIVALSIVITMAVYGGLIAGLIWAVGQLHVSDTGWLNTLAQWGTGGGAVLLATLFFPGVISSVMTLWQDAIASAVEARHYPGLPPARAIPISGMIGASVRLLGLTVAVNLLLLPLYLVLFFIPPLNVVIFMAVNGVLLSRDYFESVAVRYITSGAATALRRKNRGLLWVAGFATAALLTVPGLNLIAPMIATAAFVHMSQHLLYSKN